MVPRRIYGTPIRVSTERIRPPDQCSLCGAPPYSHDFDRDGGMIVLFQCGANRYWARGEMLAGSSPVTPTLGCKAKPLPAFYLEHRWRTLHPIPPDPKAL